MRARPDDDLVTLLRPSISAGLRGVEGAVMRPDADVALPLALRGMLALRVAQVSSSTPVGATWAAATEEANGPQALDQVADPARWSELPARTAHALAYVEQIALDPADIGPDEVRDLESSGFSAQQVVLLSQVAAFASFKVRLLHGLSLLDGRAPTAWHRSATSSIESHELPDAATRFPTLDWLPSVEPAAQPATPAGADDRTPHVWSPFYLTLLHDPEVLAQRTALYNTIMTGAGELDRADRELAALATSLTTGCRYCATVHGQRQIRLAGDPTAAVTLATHGVDALPDDRQHAIAVFASRMAPTPPSASSADIARLRQVGLHDPAITDLIAVSAMFAWANRLMMTLGTARAGVAA